MDTAVSLAADGGFDTELGGFANLAARLRFPMFRIGVAANATFSDAPVSVLVRPLGTIDFALRLEPDVRIWLGAAIGGQIADHDLNGVMAFATLDVAIPLTTRVSFDFVLRAGGFFVPGSDRPAPVAQFGIGISWDSSPVSSPR